MLSNIEDYLPYLKLNKRLEQIELMGYDFKLEPAKKVMSNITTKLKEVIGSLYQLNAFSETKVKIIKATLKVVKGTDIEDFFRFPNITPEIVEFSTNMSRGLFLRGGNIVR